MENDFILVLDLGGPQAIAMARKLRNQNYYTEILSRSANIEQFRRKAPRGILIVGGDDCAQTEAFPRAVLSLGIPVLAMGAAARMMAEAEGAVCEGILLENSASQITFLPCELFDQLSESDRYFARIDGFALPEGFKPIATTIDGLIPCFADFDRNLYGLQFYAESNDPDGSIILSNFAEKICGCSPLWSMDYFVEQELQYIQEKIGDGKALMAISGGIDSSTCALLMHRAIGNRLKCVFVDNGLLRTGEADLVLNTFQNELGLELIHIDARDRFMNRLKGITDPKEKHRAVHNEFINVLSEVNEQAGAEYLVEGTIYSDLLMGGPTDEAYARKYQSGKLIEPIRMLFKDEVRRLGEILGLPMPLINRQPFPGPALAVRCIGEVSEEKLSLLRKADAIFREEIKASGQDKRLSHFFVVLSDTRTLGRRNGAGAYEYACALRAVSEQSNSAFSVGKLPYDLLERVALRITEEVPGINRVTYDVTGSRYSMIEWE